VPATRVRSARSRSSSTLRDGFGRPRPSSGKPTRIAHRACGDVLQEVASFVDTAAAFAAASSPSVEPSNEQRARILASIAATPQLHRQGVERSMPDGYSLMRKCGIVGRCLALLILGQNRMARSQGPFEMNLEIETPGRVRLRPNRGFSLGLVRQRHPKFSLG
jgi:hypothetical protein